MTSSSRGFRAVFVAASVSTVGDGIQLVALPLLGTTLTTSPQAIAGLAAIGLVPALLFALPVGGLVDLFDRRRLLIAADVVRAALLAALVLAFVSGYLRLWELFGIAFALGVCAIVFDTCSVAYLPTVVPKDRLAKANGYLATVSEFGNGIIGPALAGTVFALARTLPFLLNAVSFVGSALMLATLPKGLPVAARRRTMQIGEGLRWILGERSLLALALVMCGWNLFGWMPEATLVLYARQDLGLSGTAFGFLFASTSIGAVLGGLLSARIIARLGADRVLYLTTALYALLMIPAAVSHSPWLVGGAFLLQGIPLVAWSVVSTTIRQTLVPGELLGRVNSVFALLGSGSAPVAMVLGGVLGHWLGFRPVFLISVAGILLPLLVAVPGLRRLASRTELVAQTA
ncbi:MAG TPA: MFS transporter [Pseudonocardiaceae bacterium]|nr:MFS transporter [Pseudonocardiaceae bacterium]